MPLGLTASSVAVAEARGGAQAEASGLRLVLHSGDRSAAVAAAELGFSDLASSLICRRGGRK